MEKVQTKTPSSRRGKFLFLGLVIVIVVLTLHIYRESNFKKDLIRRKAFLISRLRESKVDQGKLNLEVEEQKRKIAMRDTEINGYKSKLVNLESTTSSYKQKIQDLKNSANEYKASVASLQTQYDEASSSLKSLKDNLDNTMNSCQLAKDTNEKLKKEIDEKENILEKCLQEKDTKSKEKEDMEDNYKRQVALLQQTQSTGQQTQSTGQQTRNVSPALNDAISQNQLPPNNKLRVDNIQSQNSARTRSTPSNHQQTQSEQTVSDATGNQTLSSTKAQSWIPPASSVVSSPRSNKVTQLGTGTASSDDT